MGDDDEVAGGGSGLSESYHVVSFSGGKDSTAMLLRMVELDMPIDEILFCDTGAEFPQMYEHIAKVEKYIGRKITRLQAEHDFEYFLLEYRPSSHRNKKADIADKYLKGLSFPDAKVRWCTSYLKRDIVKKKMRETQRPIIQYIGIAADEPKRIKDKKYPLVEWGWTEADCLAYCKSKGFDWSGLYDIFDRVSCWCCPFQPLEELRKLRKHFPQLWQTLLGWQRRTWRMFRPDASADDLELRFALEDEWTAVGKNIKSRDFFKEYKLRKSGMEQTELF